MAHDIGPLGAARLQDEGSHMIAGETHEQDGIDDLAFVALALILAQIWKRSATGRAAVGKRVCSLAMRNTPRPIQSGAACHAKRRYDCAQLRMNCAAVIALVVVLADRLPVRRNL